MAVFARFRILIALTEQIGSSRMVRLCVVVAMLTLMPIASSVIILGALVASLVMLLPTISIASAAVKPSLIASSALLMSALHALLPG